MLAHPLQLADTCLHVLAIYFRILPCELIDGLCMGQVSGQAIAYVPYILS